MRYLSLLKSIIAVAAFAAAAGTPALLAQQPPFPPPPRSPFEGPAPPPSPIERVSPNVVRIGGILVDTAKKEFTVDGFVNEVPVLEFLVNTKGGWKAYETALEIETNAVNFNVACLLIGLDPARSVLPARQFDPKPPQGDPVEVFIEWDDAGRRRRIRAEQAIYNRVTKQALSEGPWVYTGSVFYPDNTYQAEIEGVLIGFMHNRAPIIESPRSLVGNYGDSIINPELNWKPGTKISIIVRALPRTTVTK